MSRALGVVLLSVAGGMACVGCAGDRAERGHEPTVADSAGIVVVWNEGPRLAGRGAWRVEAEPELEIGLLDGPAPYLFGSISGAIRLSDGAIAVADGSSREVRFFSGDGQHIRTVGRRGAGPGEFVSISQMLALGGDSLLVQDVEGRRMAVVHRETGVIRTVSLYHEWAPGLLVGMSADGRVVGRRPHPQGRGEGWDRDSLLVVVAALDGGGFGRVGTFAGAHRKYGGSGLGPAPLVAATPAGVWYGSGDAWELGLYDTDGVLLRLVRRRHEPEPIPAAVIEAQKAYDDSIGPPGLARPTAAATPTHYPPYWTALADREGYLWVISSRMGTLHAHVFDDEGTLLSDVELPGNFVPFEIGRDYLLTRGWDEYQVERLRLHRLHRGR